MIALRLVDPFEEVLMAAPAYLRDRSEARDARGPARPLVPPAAFLLGRHGAALGIAKGG